MKVLILFSQKQHSHKCNNNHTIFPLSLHLFCWNLTQHHRPVVLSVSLKTVGCLCKDSIIVMHNTTTIVIKNKLLLGDEKFIPPRSFNGKKISVKRSLQILNDTTKEGRRNQVDNLTYHSGQVPTEFDSNQWEYVIRAKVNSTSSTEFVLSSDNDSVLVHHPLAQDVGNDIRNFSKHVLECHAPVRNKEWEYGTMVSAGDRIEIRSAMLNHYRCSKKNTPANWKATESLLPRAGIAFHNLVQKTMLCQLYNKSIEQIVDDNNYRRVKDHTKNNLPIKIHPSCSVSCNLTNAPHQDLNDASRSYAVWFQDKRDPSTTTWFLLPYYSIAIECSSTTYISWDGTKQLHCSCTTEGKGNIYSLFYSTYENVKKHKAILASCILPKTRKFKVNDLLYVRIMQKDFSKLELQRQDYFLHNNKWSVLIANVVDVDKKGNPFIMFVYSNLSNTVLKTSIKKHDCVLVEWFITMYSNQ